MEYFIFEEILYINIREVLAVFVQCSFLLLNHPAGIIILDIL